MSNLLVNFKFLTQNRVEITVILLKNKEIYLKHLEILVRKKYNITNLKYRMENNIKKVD
jgi:hypothetical protein